MHCMQKTYWLTSEIETRTRSFLAEGLLYPSHTTQMDMDFVQYDFVPHYEAFLSYNFFFQSMLFQFT